MNLSQNRNRLTDTENKLVAAKEVGDWEGWTGVQGQQMQTITFRMDKQQGPTVQHRELDSVFWDKP